MKKEDATNKFTINYTLCDPSDIDNQPTHKQATFYFDSNMPDALNYILCRILDDNPGMEIIARSITFDNAKEYYEKLLKEERS